MPLILFACWKEEMHSTYRWLFLSENQIKKKKKCFLWWGCIVVNFMLIWKCLLDHIRGILPVYPDVIVCLTVGSKSEFRKSQIWISRTANGKKQWWEMNWRGSFFLSPATCGQGISPPTASAEQSIGQDETAVLLLAPQRDYVQPSCSLLLFLQYTAVYLTVFWLSSSNTAYERENESSWIYSCWLLEKPHDTQWLKRHWRSASIDNIFNKGRTQGLRTR